MTTGTDAFFDEMLKAAESRAQRKVRAEVVVLKKELRQVSTKLSKYEKNENAKISKEWQDTEKEWVAIEEWNNKLDIQSKELAARERGIKASEREIALAVKELKYLDSLLQKARGKTLDSILPKYSLDYYGSKSTKARALASLRSKK